MNRGRLVLLLVLFAVLLLAFGCADESNPDDSDGDASDGDTGDGDVDTDGDDINNLPDTPLQVQAMLSRVFTHQDIAPFVEWSISIDNEGQPVNDAVVTVNGVTIPRSVGFIEGWYVINNSANPAASYVAGQTYTVTVTWNGTTYTQSVEAPGDIVIDTENNVVSWESTGRYAGVTVAHVFGNNTWSAPDTQPGSLTSPQDIPASAFPTPGDYTIMAWAENSTDYFDSLHGLGVKSYCVLKDTLSVQVTK
jgi:hypothetical protein